MKWSNNTAQHFKIWRIVSICNCPDYFHSSALKKNEKLAWSFFGQLLIVFQKATSYIYNFWRSPATPTILQVGCWTFNPFPLIWVEMGRFSLTSTCHWTKNCRGFKNILKVEKYSAIYAHHTLKEFYLFTSVIPHQAMVTWYFKLCGV